MFDWCWLQLNIRGNWSTRQNWIWKINWCVYRWYRKLMRSFKWISYVFIFYFLYHNNCISLFLGLKFVFLIWIGKQINISTFNVSYSNTNDSDYIFGGNIRIIISSVALQYKCIWQNNTLFQNIAYCYSPTYGA